MGLCVNVGEMLAQEGMIDAERPQVFHIRSRSRTNKFSLVLCETTALLPLDNLREDALRNRYRSWLESAFRTLFRCHPDRPFAMLMAEATTPHLGSFSG